MSKVEVARYLSEHVDGTFPGLGVVGVEEPLTDGHRADLHLRDGGGNDIIVEVKSGRLEESGVGRLLSYYSMIENLYPPLKNVRLVVVGESISDGARRALGGFNIEFVSYQDLRITKDKIRRYFQERLMNVPTGMESVLLSELNKKNCSIIDAKYIEDSFKLNRKYSRKLLERLERKRYLERITKGKYIYIPIDYGYEERYPPINPLVVGGAMEGMYYFGYFTANTLHGFTPQHSPRVYVCSPKPHRPFTWRGNEYVFVSLVEKKFFGYENREVDECQVHVAEAEKAVLDSIDKPEYCGGLSQVLAILINSLRGELDLEKLVKYAEKMSTNSVVQRLGYLTEALKGRGLLDIDECFTNRVHALVPKNAAYSYLGSLSEYGSVGSFDRRWRIVDNVPEGRLFGEVEVR